MPADTGCDWRHLDPRFARCVSCPLPRCRYDYPVAEQATAARLIQALRGQDQRPARQQPSPTPLPRPTPPHSDRAPVVLPADALARLAQQVLGRGRSRP